MTGWGQTEDLLIRKLWVSNLTKPIIEPDELRQLPPRVAAEVAAVDPVQA